MKHLSNFTRFSNGIETFMVPNKDFEGWIQRGSDFSFYLESTEKKKQAKSKTKLNFMATRPTVVDTAHSYVSTDITYNEFCSYCKLFMDIFHYANDEDVQDVIEYTSNNLTAVTNVISGVSQKYYINFMRNYVNYSNYDYPKPDGYANKTSPGISFLFPKKLSLKGKLFGFLGVVDEYMTSQNFYEVTNKYYLYIKRFVESNPKTKRKELPLYPLSEIRSSVQFADICKIWGLDPIEIAKKYSAFKTNDCSWTDNGKPSILFIEYEDFCCFLGVLIKLLLISLINEIEDFDDNEMNYIKMCAKKYCFMSEEEFENFIEEI